MERRAQIERNTHETRIRLDLVLDGRGQGSIATKIPFFDHMLTLFARHSLCDLTVEADGDIEVDLHHTVEDTGIALGQAFARALGDKRGIRRYGWAYLPMDETLARVVVDFSGRPFLAYRAPEQVASIGAFSLHPARGIPARLQHPFRHEPARRDPLRGAMPTTCAKRSSRDSPRRWTKPAKSTPASKASRAPREVFNSFLTRRLRSRPTRPQLSASHLSFHA